MQRVIVPEKEARAGFRRMSLITSSLACALPELHLAKGALLPPGNQPKVCPDLFLGAVATSENLCSQTSLCPFGYFECLGGNATGSCEESPWALVDIDECHKWCINHPAPPPPLAPAPPGGYSPPPPLEPSDIKSMHHIEDCSSCGVDWCKKVEQGECVSFSLTDGTHALGPSISEVGCDALEDTTPYCIDGSDGIYGVGKPATGHWQIIKVFFYTHIAKTGGASFVEDAPRYAKRLTPCGNLHCGGDLGSAAEIVLPQMGERWENGTCNFMACEGPTMRNIGTVGNGSTTASRLLAKHSRSHLHMLRLPESHVISQYGSADVEKGEARPPAGEPVRQPLSLGPPTFSHAQLFFRSLPDCL